MNYKKAIKILDINEKFDYKTNYVSSNYMNNPIFKRINDA